MSTLKQNSPGDFNHDWKLSSVGFFPLCGGQRRRRTTWRMSFGPAYPQRSGAASNRATPARTNCAPRGRSAIGAPQQLAGWLRNR